jgi:hypothetical protein
MNCTARTVGSVAARNGYVLGMDRRTRLKAFFRHTDPSRYISRTWIRLVVSLLIVVAFYSLLVPLIGITNAVLVFASGAVLGAATAIYRHIRPAARRIREEPGWRMDPLGNYRWWNGSAFTEAPPGEVPRKIGPEIEW